MNLSRNPVKYLWAFGGRGSRERGNFGNLSTNEESKDGEDRNEEERCTAF